MNFLQFEIGLNVVICFVLILVPRAFLLVTWSAKRRAIRQRHFKTSTTGDERMLCFSFDTSFHPGTCRLISSHLDRAEVSDSKYIIFIPQSPPYTP